MSRYNYFTQARIETNGLKIFISNLDIVLDLNLLATIEDYVSKTKQNPTDKKEMQYLEVNIKGGCLLNINYREKNENSPSGFYLDVGRDFMTEEEALETLLLADCEVEDIESEDGIVTITAPNTEYGKIREALKEVLPEGKEFLEDTVCWLPLNEVELASDKELEQMVLNSEEVLKQLEILNPKLIITLGEFPTRNLLDNNFKKYSDVVGIIHKVDKYNILPIYHPSPISPKSYKGNLPIFEYLKDWMDKNGCR